MRKFVKSAVIVGFVAATGSISLAQVPVSLWDGFLVVHGNLQRDGTAIVCRDKEATPSGGVLGPATCNVTTFFKGEVRGRVERLKVQEVLEAHLQGELPANKQAYLVGVGPGFHMSGRPSTVSYDKDEFVIYYKLANSPVKK